jgi:tetrahydromethanopterin S-methyltransferase subunit G
MKETGSIIKITRLETEMKQVNEKLDDLDIKIDKGFNDIKRELNCYVRREEFGTVRAVVYGMVGMILTTFLGYLLTLVLK